MINDLDLALIGAAMALGFAGMPHCAAMCGAPCAALCSGGKTMSTRSMLFQAGRIGGYALGGAAAASSVGALEAIARAGGPLQPLWALVHVAALAFGLILLWHGRQPAWLSPAAGPPALQWQPLRQARGPRAALLAGSLWVAWPCALLQSALVLAALTQSAAAGAAAMAGFAVASSPALLSARWLWTWLGRDRAAPIERWAVRLAGASLVAGSAWALGHGLWERIAAFCAPG